ncbi:FAD/NAD(P)-binding protein [Streptomyces griseosporeus]|uniref:FAD/NAD(P)-binding protein n=1 Tax=Streptomyces griseosporeus TaxID=1910 RepID=UPI0036F97C6C
MATATGRGTPGRAVTYCIIGTGFSGTCALWHLVQRLTGPGRPPLPAPAPTIVTVERGPVSGPGYPYGEDNVQLAHRCNNEAGSMGLHGTDFVDWMAGNKPRLLRECPEYIRETHPATEPAAWQPDAREFYPRALFGRYLRERFQEAVERARAHGITVRPYVRHEAVDGFTAADGFRVLLRDLDTGREVTVTGVDRVLLSTGHWQPGAPGRLAGHDGYLAAPYPPDAVRAAVRGRARARRARGERLRVFVEGMGPSGIDAVLTLCGEGEFTYTPDGHVAGYRPAPHHTPPEVVAGSRSGFFPPVRGPLPSYEPHHLTEENLAAIRRAHHGHLRIEPVLELLDEELRLATGGAVGWADVTSPPYAGARDKLAADLRASATGDLVHAVVLKARRMRFYHQLAPADKAVYDRLFDTHVIRTAVPMPAANAEKLLALMDAGVLTTVRLGYGTPRTETADDGTFRITYAPDGGAPVTLRADCVVRARGQDFALDHHPSPLVQNLLRRGEIVPHEEGGYATGGIALEPGGGYRVLRRSGGGLGPSPHLSSYGPPVRFWQNEKNYAGAFVEAARSVTDDWTEAAAKAGPGPAAVDGAGLVSSETGR